MLPKKEGAFLLGEKHRTQYFEVRLHYLINPSTGLNLYVGYIGRSYHPHTENYDLNLFNIGLQSRITNSYFDF